MSGCTGSRQELTPPNATQGSPLRPAGWKQPDLQGLTSLVAAAGAARPPRPDIPGGCCWCRDPAGCVTLHEPAGQSRTGQTAEELIGNEIHMLCYHVIQRGSNSLSYTSAPGRKKGFGQVQRVVHSQHPHVWKGVVEEMSAANTTRGRKSQFTSPASLGTVVTKSQTCFHQLCWL